MNIGAWASGFFARSYKTEAANTPITQGIDAVDGKRLCMVAGGYLPAATAHLLQFMYAEGTGSRNTAAAECAVGDHHITCTDAPKDPGGAAAAASDIVAYQCSDGTWEWNYLDGIVGSILTLHTNTVKLVAIGAKVMIFGVAADLKSFNVNTVASTERTFVEGQIMAKYMGEPLYFYSPNATNAGFLQYLLFAYIDK